MKLNIVSGEVTAVHEDGLLVFIKSSNKFGFCHLDNLTDFPENLPKLFVIGEIRKFCDLNKINKEGYVILSYKFIHPEELFRKSKTIPTASHCANLYWQIKTFANKSSDLTTIKMASFKDLCDLV